MGKNHLTQTDWVHMELGDFQGTALTPLRPGQRWALHWAGFSATDIKELQADPARLNEVFRAIERGEYNTAEVKEKDTSPYVVNIGTLKGRKPTASTLRWPMDTIGTGTDYVFFQFGKYPAPFGRDEQALKTKLGQTDDKYTKSELSKNYNETDAMAAYKNYAWGESLDPDADGSLGYNIMLPMPQDLSTELQQQWQGKQFTATGRAAVAALAAGNFAHASNVVSNIAGSAKALQTALNTTVLNSIPGVGGAFEFNDISGSTRGIVINPNAELLYDSPEMREIGMIFKMVPQSREEAITVRKICQAFRKAALPHWGGKGGDLVKNTPGLKKNTSIDQTAEGNWIRVPNLCKFTFMKGATEHPYITQFKPCAISNVEVNYTPDGTYATYEDGAPIATELRVNFMETKLIFSQEITLEPGTSV